MGYVASFIAGGTFGVVIMCLFQINQNEYENNMRETRARPETVLFLCHNSRR